MSIKGIIDEVKKLSPEEKALLAEIFGGTPKNLENKPKKTNNPPEVIRAQPVYFFKQRQRYATDEIQVVDTEDGQKMMKHAEVLGPRIIATNEKEAARLFYKMQRNFQYLGRSDGKAWKQARLEGKSVAEAQELEFKQAQSTKDMTPPRSREKTFFAGTKLSMLERGQEVDWSIGTKQIAK